MAGFAIPLIGMGLSALGGIFGNRKQTQEQRTNQNTYNTGSFLRQGTNTNYNKQTPFYDQPTLDYRNNLMGFNQNRLGQQLLNPQAAANAITTQNVRGLNNQANLQNRVLSNTMRQRGLQYSPMGGTMMANAEMGRVGQAFDYMNQNPLLARQFQQEDENLMNNRLQLAQQLFGMIPKGAENEGFTNTADWGQDEQKGTMQNYTQGTQPGNMTGGGITSLADMLGFLYGRGAFGGSGKTGNSLPGFQNWQLPNVYQYPGVPQQQLPSWLQPQYPGYGGGKP